jgi:hypothetical protein
MTPSVLSSGSGALRATCLLSFPTCSRGGRADEVAAHAEGGEPTVALKLRAYKPEQDFLRIRDLLVDTRQAFSSPLNWGIERWNYARYLRRRYWALA